MKLGKLWISCLCFVFAATFSSPVLAGKGAYEMFFDKSFDVAAVREGAGFENTASIRVKKIPQNGFVVVTASGTVTFTNSSQILYLTLAKDGDSGGNMEWPVVPGQGTEGLYPQSWCVRYVFPVQKNQPQTFYLNAEYGETNYIEGSGEIQVEVGSFTAEFIKRNKVYTP